MGAVVFVALLVGLAVLPGVIERRRIPIDKNARRVAPGNFAKLSDGLTHYQWHGSPTGPVMVLIHGLTTPSWVFDGLIRGLGMMGFRVLTYDLYGRGYSDHPRTRQTRHFFIRQLRELLDELGIDEEITLLGYSMGGAIATIYAAEEPDRVDRLILVAPAGLDYRPAPILERAALWGFTGDWLWGLLGARELRRTMCAATPTPSVIPDLAARVDRELGTQGYLRSVLSAERHFLGEDLSDEHREIARMYVAVVSIWGEKDRVIPLSALGRLTELNRDAYKFTVPGAGHALCCTHPKEILEAIQENMREV